MNVVNCPRCEADVPEGSFCSRCGASLEARDCPSCGAEAPPGDRFCTRCGASLTGSPASGTPDAGREEDTAFRWWIGGLVAASVAVALLVSVLQPDRGLQEDPRSAGAPSGEAAGAAPGAAPDVDLSSMTPREAADRLFDRVMTAAERGDTAEAQNFLPMAIAAYERARPLDEDGLFHLSTLQRTRTDADAALRTAREGLEEHPDHLLLLSAAGEAARELGDRAEAGRHFERLLEVWEDERARGREEYEAHAELLPLIRDDAREFVEGR